MEINRYDLISKCNDLLRGTLVGTKVVLLHFKSYISSFAASEAALAIGQL